MRPLRYAIFALVLALGAALTAPSAHAQIIPKFGVTGGLNFGSLSDAAGLDLESSTGYHVGIFGDVGFGPLAARVSVLYVRAGDIGIPVLGDVIETEEATVSFIAVPVDAKFRFPSPVVKPYALLGPEARFAIGDLADLDAETLAFALNFGIGAELDALIGPSVFAELRYGLDVTGFAPGVAGDAANPDFRVNAFYIRVGVGL
jgi:hypothetical protein